MKQLIADLGSKATNSVLGLVKGGNDINILDNGELQLDTAYDSVDVNTSANIANITKGAKFKTILGNIVAALTGINGSVAKLNSDFTNTMHILETGYYSFSNVPARSYAEYNVKYSKEYRATPYVIAFNSAVKILLIPSAGRRDNQGFTLTVYNPSDSQASGDVRWLAVI